MPTSTNSMSYSMGLARRARPPTGLDGLLHPIFRHDATALKNHTNHAQELRKSTNSMSPSIGLARRAQPLTGLDNLLHPIFRHPRNWAQQPHGPPRRPPARSVEPHALAPMTRRRYTTTPSSLPSKICHVADDSSHDLVQTSESRVSASLDALSSKVIDMFEATASECGVAIEQVFARFRRAELQYNHINTGGAAEAPAVLLPSFTSAGSCYSSYVKAIIYICENPKHREARVNYLRKQLTAQIGLLCPCFTLRIHAYACICSPSLIFDIPAALDLQCLRIHRSH